MPAQSSKLQPSLTIKDCLIGQYFDHKTAFLHFNINIFND